MLYHKKYTVKTSSAVRGGYCSELSKLKDVCDRSEKLTICIYHVENDSFSYCNELFKNFLGIAQEDTIKRKGWDFWFSLIDPFESVTIKNKILCFFVSSTFQNRLILRYHLTTLCGEKKYVRHEIFFLKIGQQAFGINYFFDITEKEKIESALSIDKTDYDKKPIVISAREKEVLYLIADGFSSKQIADRLFISNHTAISHRKNLIEKFEVNNTAQLIKEASKVIEL